MSNFHQPVDAAEVPRFAGHSTFMRLPAATSAAGLDIALVGIPWDGARADRFRKRISHRVEAYDQRATDLLRIADQIASLKAEVERELRYLR